MILVASAMAFHSAAAALRQVEDVRALKALGAASPSFAHAQVGNFRSGIAGGGGAFDWVAAPCVPDNGIWIAADNIAPAHGCWHRVLARPDAINLTMFGARGDGVVSDYAAIASALFYLGHRKDGGTLLVTQPSPYAIDAVSLAKAPLILPRHVTIVCTGTQTVFQVIGDTPYDYVFEAPNPERSYIRNCGFDGNGVAATAAIEFYGTADAAGPMRDFGATGLEMRNITASGWIRIDNYASCATCQMRHVDLTYQTCISAPGNDPQPGSRSYSASCILLMGQLADVHGTIDEIDFSHQHAEGRYLKDAVACYPGCNHAHGARVFASDFGADHTAGSNGAYTYLVYGNGPPSSRPPTDFVLTDPMIHHPFTSALYCAGVIRCRIEGGVISNQDDVTSSAGAIAGAAIHFNGCRNCSIAGVSFSDNFRAIVLDLDVGDTTRVTGNYITYRSDQAGAIGIQIDTATLGTGADYTELLNNLIDLSAAPESQAYLFLSGAADHFNPGTIHVGGGVALGSYAALHLYDTAGGDYSATRLIIDGDAVLGGPASNAVAILGRTATPIRIEGVTFDGAGNAGGRGLYALGSTALEIKRVAFINWIRGADAMAAESSACQRATTLVFRNVKGLPQGCPGPARH